MEDSINFSTFNAVGRIIGKRVDGRAARAEDLTMQQVAFAGSCGGIATSFILTPMELIKCRLQIDRVGSDAGLGVGGGGKPRYSGPWDCFVKSVREEGVRVLYRGHSATVAREAIGTACWFSTYETAVRLLAPGVERDEVATGVILLAGATAGTMLNGVPYPLDTAKSVLQTLGTGPGGKPLGLLDVTKLIVRSQGIAGLYRGLSPALLRAVPSNAVVFLTYETLSRMLRDFE